MENNENYMTQGRTKAAQSLYSQLENLCGELNNLKNIPENQLNPEYKQDFAEKFRELRTEAMSFFRKYKIKTFVSVMKHSIHNGIAGYEWDNVSGEDPPRTEEKLDLEELVKNSDATQFRTTLKKEINKYLRKLNKYLAEPKTEKVAFSGEKILPTGELDNHPIFLYEKPNP